MSLIPVRASKVAAAALRAAVTRVMSTSKTVVTCAAARRDWTMCSAIERRIRESGSVRDPTGRWEVSSDGRGGSSGTTSSGTTSGTGDVRGRCLGGLRRFLQAIEEAQNVLLAHAAALAGSGHLGKIHAVFPGDSADQRRTARPAPPRGGLRSGFAGVGPVGAVFVCRRRCLALAAGGLLRRPCLAFGDDAGHDRVDLDGLPLGDQDFREPPVQGRRDLGVHLVGGDIEERIVAFDDVPHRPVPPDDRPLDDALAHLRHDHIGGHEGNSSRGRGGCRPPRMALSQTESEPDPRLRTRSRETGRCTERNSRTLANQA